MLAKIIDVVLKPQIFYLALVVLMCTLHIWIRYLSAENFKNEDVQEAIWQESRNRDS